MYIPLTYFPIKLNHSLCGRNLLYIQANGPPKGLASTRTSCGANVIALTVAEPFIVARLAGNYVKWTSKDLLKKSNNYFL